MAITYGDEIVAAQETAGETARIGKTELRLRRGCGDRKKRESEDGSNGELHLRCSAVMEDP